MPIVLQQAVHPQGVLAIVAGHGLEKLDSFIRQVASYLTSIIRANPSPHRPDKLPDPVDGRHSSQTQQQTYQSLSGSRHQPAQRIEQARPAQGQKSQQ